MKVLYLDDERNPFDELYLQEAKEVALVRDFEQFKNFVSNEIIDIESFDLISLDHDLGLSYPDIEPMDQPNGMTCLRFLIEFLHVNNFKSPIIRFHTANVEAFKTMTSYYNSAIKSGYIRG